METFNTEILINHTPYETRVAIVEDGILQDVMVERERRRGIVGNIYKGKVQRVLPGMDAAFIDIGLERTGFLHLKNIGRKDEDAPQRISDVLREGQTLLVQVLKDPIGSKGARLSTEISIPSRFLVFLPNADDIGVSIKIASEAQRQSLRDLMVGFHRGHQGGFIVRTAIESADMWAMRADMQYLQRVWEAILQAQQQAKPGTLIYRDLPLYLKVLRDYVSPQVSRVAIDDHDAYQEMSRFVENFLFEMSDRLLHYRGEKTLFARFGIDDEIELSLKRHVPLKSGGHLIIDQTEAMTTIDVNTGGYVGKLSQDDTIYRTNLEAAHAIARQLRLRNLGGIIMLDFIDMVNAEHQQGVMEALILALGGDKNKYTISPISPLGIIEMTRKRTRESLRQVMCETCPSCEGRGYVKSTETIVYELFRELMREAREFNPKMLSVIGSPELIDFIREEESLSFSDLQALLKTPIRLQSDTSYHHGLYEIALS
ncbi:Rne/Rng family ribonuclease [Suttonella sp. R2A3]|uniref:Rne/Rng family ribonuclease n=1 Tax=Suttonella sp. R2A3 TaxID=2908648 RepID=UPI001F1B7AFA|nr:Rne/Rng family ribonuclease [Suttonella sp. R2A3]UJF24212.1 Rne/Rng family ribonuclease [Suttonella sp. R2A3]